MSEHDEELVAVLRTADSMLLPLVKSMFDAAGIPYAIQGEQALGVLPLGRFAVGVSRRALGAIVRVPRSRRQEAEELLRGVGEAGGPPDQE